MTHENGYTDSRSANSRVTSVWFVMASVLLGSALSSAAALAAPAKRTASAAVHPGFGANRSAGAPRFAPVQLKANRLQPMRKVTTCREQAAEFSCKTEEVYGRR